MNVHNFSHAERKNVKKLLFIFIYLEKTLPLIRLPNYAEHVGGK